MTTKTISPLATPSLPALELVRTGRIARRVGVLVGGIFLLAPFALLFVPWQQNIAATGEVVALNPLDRPQTIEAPVSGRVTHFSVTENTFVEKGAHICDIVDIDPRRLERLQSEQNALQAQLAAAEGQRGTYELQIENLKVVRDASIQTAQFRRDMAKQRVRSYEEEVKAAEATLVTAEQHFERQSNLHRDGLVSTRDLQVAERDLETARADLKSVTAQLAAAESDLEAAEREIERVQNDAQAKIGEAQAKLAEADQKINSIKQSSLKLETEVSRQESQRIVAPRSGFINRLYVATDGQVVSVREPLVELVPETENLAAAIWVKGLDQPLIKPGDPVRLQFEGWPAVQFSGWPSVAVGTFGGRVYLVDPRDDGKGNFRVLVEPDSKDEPWPERRFLRQGVKAKGFVLLREVSLGYEIWRQLNGFPPTVAMDARKDDVARKRVK